MKKLIKIAAILVGLMILLLVIGSVALRIYLPPEKAKALVLTHLSTQLKREVKLGSVSVSLLSGLQMSDLKVSESPNFSKGTFLSSEQFSLKVALTPLLFHKVVVRQMALKRPEVTVIRYADGKTFNFSDLTANTVPSPPVGKTPKGSKSKKPSTTPSSSPSRGTEKAEASPFLLLVSRAEIEGGALHFVDKSPSKQSVDVAPFDLKLKNVSLTTPFTVQTAMHVKSKGEDIAINVTGQANLASGSFTIKQGSVVSRNTKVTLTGTLNGLQTSRPSVDLALDIPALKLADLAPLVVLPPNMKINDPIKASASVKGDEEKMALESQVSIGALNLTAHGQVVHPTTTPTLAMHLETNAFPVQQVLKYAPAGSVPKGVTLDGSTRLSVDLSGTAADASFAAKWTGTDLHIAQQNQFDKAVGVPLEVSVMGDRTAAGKITVKSLLVKIVSNQVTGSGTIDMHGTQPILNFEAKGTNWSMQDLAKLSPLLAGFQPSGTLSFDLHATGPANAPQTTLGTSANVTLANIQQDYYEGKNLQLVWNLTSITPDLAKVSGTASLKQGPGKILNLDKLASSSRAGKIALAPLQAIADLQQKGLLPQGTVPSLQTIPFDSVVGDYVIRSGVMTVKTFNLSGPVIGVQDAGTIGLAGAQPPINMGVTMQLPAGTGGALGAVLNDASGRPYLKFTVTGSRNNPQVKLDSQDTAKRAVQGILHNQDVQNAVGNALKGLFH